MKKVKLFTVLCFFAVASCLISCDENEGTDGVGLLKEVPMLLLEMNYEYDGNYDNNTFEYNDDGKLIAVINKYSEGDETDYGEGELKITYTYDSEGRVSEEFYQSNNDSIEYKSIYSYTDNTTTHNDFMLNEDGEWEDQFSGAANTYNNEGKHILCQYFYGWGADDVSVRDSNVYTWQNENVVTEENWSLTQWKKKRTVFGNRPYERLGNRLSKLKSGNSELRSSYDRTYDSKKNALASTGFDIYYSVQNKNNVIREVYTREEGRGGFDQTITYEYNDKGYPVRGVIKDGEQEEGIVSYKYKE